jgi:hypothetical protein
MAKVDAVSCDTCQRVERPAEGAQLPLEWYQATVFQQGSGEVLSDSTFCSWDCVNLAMKQEPEVKVRRKRRTREQMEADAAAAAATASA